MEKMSEQPCLEAGERERDQETLLQICQMFPKKQYPKNFCILEICYVILQRTSFLKNIFTVAVIAYNSSFS